MLYNIPEALRCCFSGFGALLRFFPWSQTHAANFIAAVPADFPKEPAQSCSPQDPRQRCSAGMQEPVRSPQPLISSLLFSAFFIFPRIALFQSNFTTPVGRLSSAEASKAFLKSRVSPAHSFHLPECLITPRADDGPASRSPSQEPQLSQTQFWHREPQNHPIFLLLGWKRGT